MTAVVLAPALFFIPAQAEDKQEAFKINGKPVPEIVASVNGTPLTAKLLQREYTAHTLMRQHGKEISPADEEKIARQLLIKAIDDELIYQEGLQMSIRIEPEVIDRELQHVQTQFPSKDLFLAALAYQHLTLPALKKNIERQLAEEEFVRREIVPKVKIGDEAVKTYYEKHRESFTQPETFRISHIYVGASDPEREGKAGNPEDQKKADRIIAWINKEALRKIRVVQKKLKAGQDFAALVKQYSEDESTRDKDGDLGELTAEHTLPEISDVMTQLKLNETSGIIKSPLGYHIIKLTGKTPGRVTPLAKVKSDILNRLLKEETRKLRQEYLTRLRKKADIKIFL